MNRINCVNRFRRIAKLTACSLLALLCFVQSNPVFAQPTHKKNATDSDSLTVMAWNIWHGGKEDGDEIGPQRVVDVIRDSKADIVAMQETYGSGELISKALDFHFHPRGINVSIHSRFPVIEDLSVFEEFKCVGALIELPNNRRVAFYSIWLPYNKEIWAEGTRDTSKPDAMLAACQASCDDLKMIQSIIGERLADKKYASVPVIIAGDFNSMSHLDYIPSAKQDYEVAINWPTSQVLANAGFRDSWREIHPEVNRKTDRTWTPRFPNQEQDRIDYIYYQGVDLEPYESIVIDTHQDKFPSDHSALLTRFHWLPKPADALRLRVASYNIKHCQGNDNQVDIGRTAALIRNLNADLIGLQEVDVKAKRSHRIDQPTALGKELNMHHAFGKFMDFQSGEYGMAVLSRYPILKSQCVELPAGGEPRVALVCEIELPNKQTILAVNVHFDWVADDTVRFAQAQKLAEFLNRQDLPFLLLGDFNDQLGSRTLDLLSKNMVMAKKPKSDRFTFSSIKPKSEIDFIFASPLNKWHNVQCLVLDATVTSDHRPVISIFDLKE